MSEWKDSDGGGGFPGDEEARPPWAPEPSPEPPVALSSPWDRRVWPVAVALSLFVVVCVNLAFIYIAVSGADEVVPSYVEGER